MSAQTPQMGIYAIKTTSGRELDVALIIERRVLEKLEKGEEPHITSIFIAPGISGFVFIEARRAEDAYRLVSNIKYVKASRALKVSLEEAAQMLKPKLVVEELNVGDEVEIVRGPFRGMRARVVSIDKSKSAVTVNLLEAAFSIPVTIQISYVKKVKG